MGLDTKVGGFGGKIRPLSLGVCGALALSMFSVLAFQAAQVSASPSSGYTSHAPIYITSNDNFVIGQNGVTSGSGTGLDPYIIEGWAIDASSANGIRIENTTKYFVIQNCLVENGGYSYLGIGLHNVVNGKIENNTCRNNGWGILLNFSSNGNLTGNTCENNSNGGIGLHSSSNNTLTSNTCENNAGYGIHLSSGSDNDNLTNNTCLNNSLHGIYLGGSSNNTISNNTCENNNYEGIYLFFSSNGILTNNTCENNSNGIYLSSTSNNTIFHNYLLNNAEKNAYDNGTNYWDHNGEGNYWSDWQPPQHPDTNNDGIVDQQRSITGGSSVDHYPLVFGYVPPTTTTTTTTSSTTTSTTSTTTTTTTTSPAGTTTTTTTAPPSEVWTWVAVGIGVIIVIAVSAWALMRRR
jgi:parallel beta-helix repeat protein